MTKVAVGQSERTRKEAIKGALEALWAGPGKQEDLESFVRNIKGKFVVPRTSLKVGVSRTRRRKKARRAAAKRGKISRIKAKKALPLADPITTFIVRNKKALGEAWEKEAGLRIKLGAG